MLLLNSGMIFTYTSMHSLHSTECIHRFLKNLLLVHGRWSYRRTSKLVLYSFYKNMCLSFCLFWFTCYSLFSAQVTSTTTIQSFIFITEFLRQLQFIGIQHGVHCISCDHRVHTSVEWCHWLTLISRATLDQDVKARSALKYPQMYATGQTDEAVSCVNDKWSHWMHS